MGLADVGGSRRGAKFDSEIRLFLTTRRALFHGSAANVRTCSENEFLTLVHITVKRTFKPTTTKMHLWNLRSNDRRTRPRNYKPMQKAPFKNVQRSQTSLSQRTGRASTCIYMQTLNYHPTSVYMRRPVQVSFSSVAATKTKMAVDKPQLYNMVYSSVHSGRCRNDRT